MPENPTQSSVVHYYGTVASQQQRGLNALLLLLRIFTFFSSLASVVIMATDVHDADGGSVKWYNFDAYRYVLAVNAIICTYSLAETGMGFWTLFKGTMLMPDLVAFWFDYAHDQGFAYLLFSASSAGTSLAKALRNGKIHVLSTHTCSDAGGFCTQAEIGIAISFLAFILLAGSSLLSGFRLAKWLISS